MSKRESQGGNPATDKKVCNYSISASNIKNNDKGYYQGFKPVKINSLKELGKLMLTHSLSSQLYGEAKTPTQNGQMVKYRKAIDNIIDHGQAVFFDIDNKVRVINDEGVKVDEICDPEPVTLDMIVSKFKELGWGCVITPSRSSIDKWQKFHIGCFVTGDVGTHEQFRKCYLRVLEVLKELKLDKAMKSSVQNCTPARGRKILKIVKGDPIPFDTFTVSSSSSSSSNSGGGSSNKDINELTYNKDEHNLHLENSSEKLSLDEMIAEAESAEGDTVRCGCHNSLSHGKNDSGAICQLNSDKSIHYHCAGCGETVRLRETPCVFEKREGYTSVASKGYVAPEKHEPTPSKFNINLLPKDAQKFALQGAIGLDNSPVSMFGVGVMVMLGNAIGRRVGVRVKQHDNWTEYPNLWGALIAPPSFKKSPIIKGVGAPLKVAEGRANDRYKEKMSEYEKEMHSYKLNKSMYEKDYRAGNATGTMPEEPKKPIRKRHIIDDATVESVGQIMVDNPNGLLLLKDELSGFFARLTSANREGDRSFWLEAYTHQRNLNVDRVGRGSIIIPHVIAGIFGAIQPDVIQKVIYDTKKGATGGDGLLQRFQLSVIETQTNYKFSDTGIKAKHKESYFNLVEKILKRSPHLKGAEVDKFNPFDKDENFYYRFSKEATEVYKIWSEDNNRKIAKEEIHNPALASHLGKYNGTFAKLALVLFYCDRVTGRTKENTINARYAKKAIEWVTFLESHARVLYDMGEVEQKEKENLDNKIIAKVQEYSNDGKLPMSLGILAKYVRGADKKSCEKALKSIAKIKGSKIIRLLKS